VASSATAAPPPPPARPLSGPLPRSASVAGELSGLAAAVGATRATARVVGLLGSPAAAVLLAVAAACIGWRLELVAAWAAVWVVAWAAGQGGWGRGLRSAEVEAEAGRLRKVGCGTGTAGNSAGRLEQGQNGFSRRLPSLRLPQCCLLALNFEIQAA
jgi:hypothetical protein